MSNPWNGKAVLEAFWWDCAKITPLDWYTYLTKLVPRLAACGFDGILTPPPCKDTGSKKVGYTPYDYYDLGQKFQNGETGTAFGTMDAFLRLVAVAHANGLEVYPDIVLPPCGRSEAAPSSPIPDQTRIQPVGFAGPGKGRWPANDWHGSDPNSATRQYARAWFSWFVRQTGVDGFRFSDMKGYPPQVVEDLLYNGMGDRRDFFCAAGYLGTTAEIDSWADATQNRAGTCDYPLHSALADLVNSHGFYDVGRLPSLQQKNRYKTVPFVNNHDNHSLQVGCPIDPNNPRTRLAYAVAITMDGSPQFFLPDLYSNYLTAPDPKDLAARSWILNLLWCHQKLDFKSGPYLVRYQNSRELLILERGGRAIVAINNDGNRRHGAWIPTAFPPGTQLLDYSGSCPDPVWTNRDGWAHISVPPLAYSVWGPVGVWGGFAPTPRRTVQQFELDDDLGDSNPLSLGYGGKAVTQIYRCAGAIWPAVGSHVNLSVQSDTPHQVDLQVLIPGSKPVLKARGTSGPDTAAFTNQFTVLREGYHFLLAKLTKPSLPARLYLKVDYIGPTEVAGL